MQHHSMSWIEVQFLKMAVDVLCSCRQTLMYTYVFAFYLLKNNQSIIFEVSSIAFCLSYVTVRWCILWICCNFPSIYSLLAIDNQLLIQCADYILDKRKTMISTPYTAKIQFGRLLSLPENESTHPIQRKVKLYGIVVFLWRCL